MSKTYRLVWGKLQKCRDIGLFLWGSKKCIFGQYITLRPKNLVHLCLCQHFPSV